MKNNGCMWEQYDICQNCINWLCRCAKECSDCGCYNCEGCDCDGAFKFWDSDRVDTISSVDGMERRLEKIIGEMVRDVLTYSSDTMYNKGYTDALMGVLAWLKAEL